MGTTAAAEKGLSGLRIQKPAKSTVLRLCLQDREWMIGTASVRTQGS
jgi:hypothetical protein